MRGFFRIILVASLISVMLFGFSAAGAAYGESVGDTIVNISGSSLGSDLSQQVSVPVVNFSDLDQAAWAKKAIVRLKIRGITSGYSDGTYRPNIAITQAEALIMAVRELGLEQEAANLAGSSNLFLPQAFGRDIPAWAKGSVAVGWQRNLIKIEDDNFKWNAPASRAWVAQLAVRMMGMENQTIGQGSFSTSFTDDKFFPEWSRKYVVVAVDKNILVGYQDGSFQPARTVTRAELATILAKCENYMNLGSILQGTVEDVNEDNIIVFDKQDNLFRLFKANGTWIFSGSDIVEFDSIEEGDRVVLVMMKNNVAGFIDIEEAGDTEARSVTGEVTRVDTFREEIRIEDEDGDLITYSVDDDADIIIEDVRNPELDDVNVGDEVELEIRGDIVLRLEVIENSDSVKGEVVSLDTADLEIRIEDEDGDRKTYSVDDDADIIIEDVRNPELDDVNVGDNVELEIRDDLVLRLEVIENTDSVRGEVVSVDTTDLEIRIQDEDGDRTTYVVEEDCDIIIDGYGNPSLSDVDEGDEVRLKLAGGDVEEIEVIDTNVEEYIIGLIYRVDAANRLIRIEDRDGDRTTYEVHLSADIEVPGDSTADLDDLDIDEPVRLGMGSDKVEEIIQGRVRSGTINSVDDNDYEISVERNTGTATTYSVNEDVSIEFGSRFLDLDELTEGDEVDLYEFDDEIYLIVVTDRN